MKFHSSLAAVVCHSITFNGWPHNAISGIIRNNRVLLSAPYGFSQFGINGSWDANTIIEGNYIEGANVAVYGDTGGCTNMLITHNVFRNCYQAVSYSGYGNRYNITIDFNNIEVTTNGESAVINLWNGAAPGYGYMTNVLIFGNTIGFAAPGSSPDFVLAASNVRGLVFANNSVDAQLANNEVGTIYFTNVANLSMYNNNDIFGNYLPQLNIPTIGGTEVSQLGLDLISSSQPSTVLTNLGLPSNPLTVVTNNESGVTLNGTFSGNGGGLTNIQATNITGGINITNLPFYIRAGTAGPLGASITSGTIVFSTPVPDTHYAVSLIAITGTTPIPAWCTAKATNSFTFTFGSSASHPSLEYIAVQQQ